MDDNENARYLAAYIIFHQDSILSYSFDRTASHSTGEYQELVSIDQDALERIITQYYADLL